MPKSGDIRALPNQCLVSFQWHNPGVWMAGLWHAGPCVTMHSLPSMVCRRPSVVVRSVTHLVGTAVTQPLLLNKANELINKRRIYYLNAHRRKMHAGGRWKRAFICSSAVCKKELKGPDRLFGVLFVTRNTQRKDCQRYFFRTHYFLTLTTCF